MSSDSQNTCGKSPNDPKLSDGRSGRATCAERRAKAAGWLSRSRDRVARSLERMVRRCGLWLFGGSYITDNLDALNERLSEGGWCWGGLYGKNNVLFYRVWRPGIFGFTEYQINLS